MIEGGMVFLPLTGSDSRDEPGRPLIVNLEAIDAIEQREGFTEIRTRGHHFIHVAESKDAVERLIRSATEELNR